MAYSSGRSGAQPERPKRKAVSTDIQDRNDLIRCQIELTGSRQDHYGRRTVRTRCVSANGIIARLASRVSIERNVSGWFGSFP
jgi:hypothetical protein